MNHKTRKTMTRREELVRRVARAVGKNLTTVAVEMGFSPSNLYQALKSRRPTNETLSRISMWLSRNGSSVSVEVD